MLSHLSLVHLSAELLTLYPFPEDGSCQICLELSKCFESKSVERFTEQEPYTEHVGSQHERVLEILPTDICSKINSLQCEAGVVVIQETSGRDSFSDDSNSRDMSRLNSTVVFSDNTNSIDISRLTSRDAVIADSNSRDKSRHNLTEAFSDDSNSIDMSRLNSRAAVIDDSNSGDMSRLNSTAAFSDDSNSESGDVSRLNSLAAIFEDSYLEDVSRLNSTAAFSDDSHSGDVSRLNSTTVIFEDSNRGDVSRLNSRAAICDDSKSGDVSQSSVTDDASLDNSESHDTIARFVELSQKVTTDEPILQCKHCPRVFSSAEERLTHTRAEHAKKKLYNCRYCDAAFRDPKQFKHHLLAHKKDLVQQ